MKIIKMDAWVVGIVFFFFGLNSQAIATTLEIGVNKMGDFRLIGGSNLAGQSFTISQSGSDNAPVSGTLHSGAGNSQQRGSFPSGNDTDTYNVTLQNTNGTFDNFHVKVQGTTSVKSVEEGGPKTAASFIRDDSPFASLTNSNLFFFSGISGELVDQFNLTNSSSNAFEISSLQLYEDLSMSFFNPASFDSAAALSSGALFRDVNAEDGNWVLNPDQLVMFSLTPPSSRGYELLVGSGQQVLPGGSLGAPFTFAFANADVPEPSYMLPCAMCFAGFAALYIRRTCKPGR